MKKSNPTIRAQILRSTFYVLLLLGFCAIPLALAQRSFNGRPTSAPPSRQTQRTLTFAERVAYQRAIEEVYWRHRIWPKQNAKPKPSLDEVMSAQQTEKKVQDYLRDSQALESYWHRPIAPDQLQAEMERMAGNTKQPDVLRELFEALGNDPFVIAECLARPVLTERLGGSRDPSLDDKYNREAIKNSRPLALATTVRGAADPPDATYTLPVIASPSGGCTDDTWTATSTTNAPVGRIAHTAVWTGTEMIVWGGYFNDGTNHWLNTGGRYNPSTDSWTATSTTDAPDGREFHTAIWTGTEMIVWGGYFYDVIPHIVNTGGRYNPSTDSWTATGLINAPVGRSGHTAVWTGTEMIVWGGGYVDGSGLHYPNTGGRYNPSTDTWTNTNTTNTPDGRTGHTAVWTSTEMIVWGGSYRDDSGYHYFNTGGRYNPATDSWTPTSTTNAPSARQYHTAVWTGTEMINWGGYDSSSDLNTGGRYNPSTDSWTDTSTTNVPDRRYFHTAVWTSSEMIVWGGFADLNFFDTGGRYNPGTDSWIATSRTNAPEARINHTAVWTGSRMIVFGGTGSSYHNTGGQYCAPSRSSPLPRARPTPAPRP
jgi:N-acetylneuraminic acid mutarotase